MQSNELYELLPLYVNGQLGDEEKTKVEQALQVSPELREELRFWEDAKRVTLMKGDSDVESHPSAGEIIDYATGMLPDPVARVTLERHIQGCSFCLNEVSVIREMRSSNKPALVNMKRWLRVRGVRLAFGVSFAAALVILVVMMNREPRTSTEAILPAVPDSTALSIPLRTPVVLTFTLPMQMVTVRGSQPTGQAIPEFVLDYADSIRLVVPVLHSQAAAAYLVSLRNMTRNATFVQETVHTVEVKEGVAYLHLRVEARTVLPGKHIVTAKEILKSTSTGLDPESYNYTFTFRRP